MVALSIVIGGVIWWFLTSQYGLSFILLLITGLVYFLENNSADNITVHITELGIQIGESFYDFSKISSLSYIYEWESAILLRLHMNKKWIRSIDLPIENTHVNNIKNILENIVEEQPDVSLNWIEKLIRKFDL